MTLVSLHPLFKEIIKFKPDIIHAHYGFSGLLAAINRKVPVVVTFHGSDINLKSSRIFSKLAIKLAKSFIFVSFDIAKKAGVRQPVIIPCGVNLEIFKPID